MATRQETNKAPEQAKEPARDQTKQPTSQSKSPDTQTKTTEPNRPSETAPTPHRGGSMARSGQQPLARLREEFDRLFDQFSRGMFGLPVPRWDTNWGLDMREDGNTVIVRAEAPGFEASDFDIRVHGDRLIMVASRNSEEGEEGYRGWRRNEFSETLTLPADVDADKVKATYRNGVLTVTLPKSENGNTRRISVEG